MEVFLICQRNVKFTLESRPIMLWLMKMIIFVENIENNDNKAVPQNGQLLFF